MRYIVLASLLLLTTPSWAAITFDAASSAEAEAGSGTSHSHTFGANSNVALICLAFRDNSGAVQPATGVTVDGNAATFLDGITNASNVMRAELWYYLAPPSGAQTIATTHHASTDRKLTAVVSYDGVAQTTTFNTAATNRSSSANMDVTAIASAVGEMGVLCGSTRLGASAVTASPDATSPTSTERRDTAHTAGANSLQIHVYEEAGASGTIDMRVDLSESVQWAAVAVSMRPLATSRRTIGVLNFQ